MDWIWVQYQYPLRPLCTVRRRLECP